MQRVVVLNVILFIFMLSVIMLSDIMLGVIKLDVSYKGPLVNDIKPLCVLNLFLSEKHYEHHFGPFLSMRDFEGSLI
jgi:hypothetical protein